MASKFNWNGKKIARKYLVAARRGVDMTTAACVAPAKMLTPVITGTAQGSIQMRPARIVGQGVVGVWGSFQVDYFIWLEIGARGRPGHFMLRRTADAVYPRLRANIRLAARL